MHPTTTGCACRRACRLPSVLSGCWSATDDGGSAPITARIIFSPKQSSARRADSAVISVLGASAAVALTGKVSFGFCEFPSEEKNFGIFL